MKKPMLGIFAVFCLHIGFVAYNTTESYLDTALKSGSVPDPLSSVTETTGISDAELLIATITEEPTEIGKAAFVFASSNKAGIKRSAVQTSRIRRANLNFSVAQNSSSVPSRVNRFRNPEIALSERTSAANVKAENAGSTSLGREPLALEYADLPTKPQPEGKSFLRKALPIIKKPYDWIKAIASKLN